MIIRKTLLSILALVALPILADQVIPPQNYGPPYWYPANPAERLYKLPWTEGRSHEVTGAYGSDPASGYHHPDYSVDFDHGQGEAIRAARAGRVNLVYNMDMTCNIPTSQGNKVIIIHQDSMPDSTMANGWRRVYVKDLYLHVNNNIPVKVGDVVQQGQIIAYASCTGQDGGGPHLHFKAWIDSMQTAQGWWRHLGWFDSNPTYKFTSVPTPFVEITNRPNGLPEMGDVYVSQNQEPSAVESGRPAQAPALLVSPNPFNPRATVSFSLCKGASVLVDLLSVSGERKATLMNTTLGTGPHSLVWNAGDLPCGVYFVRLKIGSRVTVEKVSLIR